MAVQKNQMIFAMTSTMIILIILINPYALKKVCNI